VLSLSTNTNFTIAQDITP